MSSPGGPRVLLTGGEGRLARAVAPEFRRRGWVVHAPGRRDLDVTRPDQLRDVGRRWRPAAVVNLAAWTDADACEAAPEVAHAVNAVAVATLAELCHDLDAHLCHVSTDYVFDGARRAPYREDDPAHPLSAYGRSKLAGEAATPPEATLVRIGWVSGRYGRSLVRTVLEQALDPKAELAYVHDRVGSPTVADDAARVIVELVERRHAGVLHVANSGFARCDELARRVLRAAGDDPGRIRSIRTAELRPQGIARRPPWSALDTSALETLGLGLRTWEDAVDELVEELVHVRAPARAE